MKRNIYSLIILFNICLLSAGCAKKDSTPQSEIVAEINDYKMTVEDIKDTFDTIATYNIEVMDEEVKNILIQDMIRKELLLQEAQRLNLDKEKEFMKTIENYWEQALIKSLLNKETKEIANSIKIRESEITDYYSQMKEKDPELSPIDELRAEIILNLKKQKETQALEEWINTLEKNAKVIIHEDVLKKIDLSK